MRVTIQITKCLLLLGVLAFTLAWPVRGVAQSFEMGGFAGYSRLDLPNFPQNTVSAGARMDFPFIHFVKLEVEGAYDFFIPQVEFSTVGSTAVVTVSQVGGPRINAGLKFQSRGGSYFFFPERRRRFSPAGSRGARFEWGSDLQHQRHDRCERDLLSGRRSEFFCRTDRAEV
jgi:hypothetical protein